jgi:flagellar biosynthesis protein FlhB
MTFSKKATKTKIHKEITKEILKLSTSAFGLVAALAWNELIKEIVSMYIKPLVGGASGIISLSIYAVIVTTLAVLITISLSKLANKN